MLYLVFFYLNLVSNYSDLEFSHAHDIVASYALNFIGMFDLKGDDSCKNLYDFIIPSFELLGIGRMTSVSSDLKFFKIDFNLFDNYNKFYSNILFEKFQIMSFLCLKGGYEFFNQVTTDMIISNDFSNIEFKVLRAGCQDTKLSKKLQVYVNKSSNIVKL